jgi:hypothetical protein
MIQLISSLAKLKLAMGEEVGDASKGVVFKDYKV